MPIDSTPDQVKLPTREKRVADYKRDYRLRNPEASTAEGEQPDIDAKLLADQFLPVDAQAKRAGDALTYLNQEGTDLDNTWEPRGVSRPKAKGAIGYVTITAAAAGAPIFLDDEITDPNTGLRFKCLLENLSWKDGDSVPIGGVDVGPQSNFAAGTKLIWSQPRPGLGENATVLAQTDGDGLTGGRDAATDEEYRELIAYYSANPPAAGNDSQIQLTASKTPGVNFSQVFTYPGILGSCTSAVVGVVNVSKVGASRKATELQRQALESWVTGQFPHGDIYYFPSTLGQSVDVVLDVRWSKGVVGWIDSVPWPPRKATGSGKIVVDVALNSIAFVLRTDDNDYIGVTDPQAGQTIGFWDRSKVTFSKKKILTVTGSGPWMITCDNFLGVSDVSFVPEVGQPCCPWSSSMTVVALGIIEVFKRVGPGEMLPNTDFFDEGQRRRRSPESPVNWPSVLANKDLSAVLNLPEIADGVFIEGADVSTTVGAPGVTAYLLEPGYFTLFPKAIS